MTKEGHWRTFTDMSHLRAECLRQGEEIVATIKEVKSEKITDRKGKSAIKPVAYFVEDVLPMVLNVTNCDTLTALFGSGEPKNWVGNKVQIYVVQASVGGIMTPSLRIRNFRPTESAPSYKCAVCGKEISKELAESTTAKYGKPLCSAECAAKDKADEDLI